MTLEQVLKQRNKYAFATKRWVEYNNIKAEILEQRKSSLKETIIGFLEEDLEHIPEGFSSISNVEISNVQVGKRSLFEYANGFLRHPIPYCIIKYQDKYFFTLREKQSGEKRLVGKVGLVGGHVGEEGIEEGLLRELSEEVGVTKDMIINSELKGVIKSNNNDTDKDHLGFVYQIEINTDQIKSEEEGTLKGIWINKDELKDNYNKFESWSQIVFDNVLNK